MEVPPGMVVMGTPAKIRREVSAEERKHFKENCDWYVMLGREYKEAQN
jgi:carbonic anhydrase/acetyltransferase-like protein (isoleucine patch superfamily)